ncbi:MAG TPA: dTDP-4-dehydrorhamnose 3,5-epimerase family protein [Acidimicrobiales bacterium]
MDSNIGGVSFYELESRRDDRGALTELFRSEWGIGVEPVQWNVVSSFPGVMRGVHCHHRHDDLLGVAHGELVLGLADARTDSPTFRRTELVRVRALSTVVRVPVGVAHGFYFEEPTTMVYAVTDYWDPDDELGCRWDAPDLGIDWPASIGSPQLSPRDEEAGSFSQVIDQVAAARGATVG